MPKPITNNFSQQVYNLCSQIPVGYVSTYKHIAQFLNTSPRAVGQVLKNNPYLSELVPCHRVIASNYFIVFMNSELAEKIIDYLKKLEKNEVSPPLSNKKKNLLLVSKREYDELDKEQQDYQELVQAVSPEEQTLLREEINSLAEQKNQLITKIKEQIIAEEGVKQNIVMEIRPVKGNEVYNWLKNEAGVHRVQRVPQTESRGRIHTSTASVVVLPEVQDIALDIRPQDLRIDTYRSSGAGGQHVNTTDSAVRITHISTGIVATSQDGRSQHDNKEKALFILKSRLLEKLQSDQQKKTGNLRSTMIGTAERSEKIRTYNYPQNRVTDHRLGVSWNKLNFIIEGDLAELNLSSVRIWYKYHQPSPNSPRRRKGSQRLSLPEKTPQEKKEKEESLNSEEISEPIRPQKILGRVITNPTDKNEQGEGGSETLMGVCITSSHEEGDQSRPQKGTSMIKGGYSITTLDGKEISREDKSTICDSTYQSLIETMAHELAHAVISTLILDGKLVGLDDGGHGPLHDDFIVRIENMIKNSPHYEEL
ncbi:2878_t:CDS:2 [Entrophospora sp. SA101]|nr:2878_t:CDS:2 [Entrophospora sp. SA101]